MRLTYRCVTPFWNIERNNFHCLENYSCGFGGIERKRQKVAVEVIRLDREDIIICSKYISCIVFQFEVYTFTVKRPGVHLNANAPNPMPRWWTSFIFLVKLRRFYPIIFFFTAGTWAPNGILLDRMWHSLVIFNKYSLWVT